MRTQKTVSISLLLFALLSAVLAGCGALTSTASPDITVIATAPPPTDVVITLKDNKIVPSLKTFTPGVTYAFYVANAGKKHHGLAIVPAALDVTKMTAAQLQQVALFIVADVGPQKGMSVTYTFPATSAGVSYQMVSPLPGDYKAGLILPITVKTSS